MADPDRDFDAVVTGEYERAFYGCQYALMAGQPQLDVVMLEQRAYRCRHGHSSASAPDPGRPKNLYIREDRILPHLAGLYVLLTGAAPAARRRRRTRRGADLPPASDDAAIGYLRARHITLTYDPRAGTCGQTRPRP